MNKVTAFFVRAKHWQIFILIVGTMFVGDFAVMVPSGIQEQPSPLFYVVMLLFAGCLLGWLGSMGLFLDSIVEPSLRLGTGFLRFALIYPTVYIPVFIAIFLKPTPRLFAIILPFHLLAMFCMFYLLYFASKNLVLAETGKSASFYDYAGPFFLIWFVPIGVWFVQPRVNQLYAKQRS